MVNFPGGMTGGRRLLCSILHSSDFDSSAYELSKQVAGSYFDHSSRYYSAHGYANG
jgi:hypothetical protein